MTARPLFDRPIAQPTRKPKRRAKRPATPLIPVAPKPLPETWTVQFSAAPGDVPPVCRIKHVLKFAWRRHHLRAKIIAQPAPAAKPGNQMTNGSSNGQRGPQIGLGKAKMARLVALRNKIATLAASLHENQ